MAMMAMATAGADATFEFRETETGLTYRGAGWAVRSARPRGWVSLTVNGAEFLDANASRGGIVFQRADGDLVTRFPGDSIISHDNWLARQGGVNDGVYLLQVKPERYAPAFELYAGFNASAPHKVVLILSDHVSLLRLGRVRGERSRLGRYVTRASKPGLVRGEGVVIVHESGVALTLNHACEVGMVADETGAPRLAVVLAADGFAANSFPFQVEAFAGPENFVLNPQFDVRSSDDAIRGGLGATHGVHNPVYTAETELDFRITFQWLGAQPLSGYAELDIVHALGEPHFRQRIALEGIQPDDNGLVSVRFEPTFSLPGVSEVWGRLVIGDHGLAWVDRYRMAYELETFEPDIVVEPDMREFWEATLAELRAVPLEPEVTRVFEDFPDWELYEVSFNSLDGQRIWALLYVPAGRERPLPAIVSAHPGTVGWGINRGPDGVYGSRIGRDDRFVTIVPLVRGYRPDADDVPFNHPWWGPLEDRDRYVARYWYSALVRAVDYLATRPDLVDMERLVAMGGSQGGNFAVALTALDPRIRTCFADCPSNAQPHELMTRYGSFGPTAGQVPDGRTLAETIRMLSYFNPVNMAPWIRVSTYIGSNIGDLTVHSMGPLAIYRNLTALPPEQKAFYPGFTHAHGSGPGLAAQRSAVLDRLAGE